MRDRFTHSQANRLSVRGTIWKTFVLLAFMGATSFLTARYLAWERWPLADVMRWFTGATVAGVVIALLIQLWPRSAWWLAPCYACLQGGVLLVFTRIIEKLYPALPGQALFLSAGMLLVLSLLSASGLVVLGKGVRTAIFYAMVGLLAHYLSSALFYYMGWHGQLGAGYQSGITGMLTNGGVLLLSCLVYLDDFQRIREMERKGMSQEAEWYWAFVLLADIVWVYIRILRFLLANEERKGKRK